MSFQQWRSAQDSNSRANNTSVFSLKNHEIDKNSWGWSWLERWMAAKPWETRLMEQSQADTPSEIITPPPKNSMDSLVCKRPKSSEPGSVKVRKNNMSTRISAKPPPLMGQATRSSSSPSSEFRYDESSASSSFCTSTTPVSGNTMLASDRTDDSTNSRPNYMSLTESTKAKQRVIRQSMDEFQFMKKSAVFSNADSKSTVGSDQSSTFNNSRPLYLMSTQLDRNAMKLSA